MARTGPLKIPSPPMPAAPRSGPSGHPVRPTIIRAMLKTQKAFEEAGRELDRFLDAVGEEARSGRPPPPVIEEDRGGRQ